MRLSRIPIRIIPLMLAAVTFLLGTKLFELADAFRLVSAAGNPITEAHAQPPKHDSSASKSEATGNGHDAPPAKDAKPAGDGPAAAPPGTPKPLALTAPEGPPPPTPQEMEVLQRLTQRREALEARSRELDRQADLLNAANARLDQKLKEMKELEKILVGLIKTHDEQQETKLRSLVKIYENMKPKDAARIFEELEMETLLPVAERMGERKLAPVMAVMNPAKAKAITEELSRLRQLASGNRQAKAG